MGPACRRRTGCAVEVAGRIGNHATVRVCIAPAREVVEHRFLPGWTDLVHHPHLGRAAVHRGPIQITGGIHHHRGVRIGPIRAATEGVQYGLVAKRVQLVDHARIRRSAIVGCAVEVAGGVERHSGIGIRAIGPAFEAVQDLVAGLIELEDHAEVGRAALVRGSVHIAAVIADQRSVGSRAFGEISKGVDDVLDGRLCLHDPYGQRAREASPTGALSGSHLDLLWSMGAPQFPSDKW